MMTDQPHPMVLLESFSKGHFANSYRFEGLQATVIARSQEEVIPALAEVQRAVSQGSHAAGFVSYEAASALNPDLSHKIPATDQPLVWFGIFKERHSFRPDNEAGGVCEISPLRLNILQ